MSRRQHREVVQMRAVGALFPARCELVQRDTREGLTEHCSGPGTGAPGSAGHDRLHGRRNRAVVADGNTHAVIVILELADHAILSRCHHETPPEAWQLVYR